MNTELVSSDAPSEGLVFNKLGECELGGPRTEVDTELVSSDSPCEGVIFNKLVKVSLVSHDCWNHVHTFSNLTGYFQICMLYTF